MAQLKQRGLAAPFETPASIFGKMKAGLLLGPNTQKLALAPIL
jgi:hypothetical protein